MAVCEYCGTKYSIGRLREKIQEIRETVKTKGSVDTRQTGTGEDVERWRSLLRKYMQAFDYENATKIVSKILEALPTDKEAGAIYDQLQDAKYLDIRNGVLVKYNGQASKVVIPDGVMSIGDEAFLGCRSLTSVTIPDNVTSIGDRAFFGCRSLRSITIPDSVTSIGGCAFSSCSSLTSIAIPDSVTSIGAEAFSWCSSLTSITIGDGVTSIGACAFSGCSSLRSIAIPDSVTSIGGSAFAGCSSLTSITYGGTKAQWQAIRKGSNWNSNTGKYTIHCKDGDIAK